VILQALSCVDAFFAREAGRQLDLLALALDQRLAGGRHHDRPWVLVGRVGQASLGSAHSSPKPPNPPPAPAANGLEMRPKRRAAGHAGTPLAPRLLPRRILIGTPAVDGMLRVGYFCLEACDPGFIAVI
jgi:hypothetical protein